MKKFKRVYLGLGIAIVLMAVVLLALKSGGTPVETVQVQSGDITRTVVERGYVQPSTNHELYATQAAKVIQVPVKTGQTVSKGETLVVLENIDLSVQVNDTSWQLSQAEAASAASNAALQRTNLELRNAEDNYNRYQELYKTESISKVEYEKALLQLETLRQIAEEQNYRLISSQAQANGLTRTLQQLTAKEKQLVLTSPTSGIVLSLPVQIGQVLVPGTLIASVAVADSLEIKADILSDDLAEINEGQKVNITAQVLGNKSLTGRVKQIYPQAEEKMSALGVAQRKVPIIISLEENANLKPGFEVKVSVETMTRHNVLQVPLSALITNIDGQKEVMVIKNNVVFRRTVITAVGNSEKIEITEGLNAGDIIVRDGSLSLSDKAKVKLINK